MSAALDKCRKRCAELEREFALALKFVLKFEAERKYSTVDQYARSVWEAVNTEYIAPANIDLIIGAVGQMSSDRSRLHVWLSDCRQWIGVTPTSEDDAKAVAEILQEVDEALAEIPLLPEYDRGD